MAAKSTDRDEWTERVRTTLGQYAEPLAREIASRLTKPRIGQTVEDLIEKAAETLANAIVIDRRLKELEPAAQAILIAIGLSRQPRWKVSHLIALSAARGFPEGLTPILSLLQSGLVSPYLEGETAPIADLTEWIGRAGMASATVFVHPVVATRARGMLRTKSTSASTGGAALESDGLDWPLRLAVAWQLLRATPIKMTQAGLLFKRDLTRLQTEEVLTAPLHDIVQAVPDIGVLAFEWAVAAGLFQREGTDFLAQLFAGAWKHDIAKLLEELFAGFFSIDRWDPVRGYVTTEGFQSALPTVALEIVCQLAEQPNSWHSPAELANHLWENHPSFSAVLPRETIKLRGVNWVETFLGAIAYPLRIVEVRREATTSYRLSKFGKYLLLGEAELPPATVFPQTLMVQPNADVIVYRQGLTPLLIAELSRFAKWKLLGSACTLELTAEETYRGLESGLSIASLVQTLDRHSQRPVPPTIADLLRRWSDKRERITVYSGVTLVEFVTPAELENALARGIVTVKITDRIALTATGRDPEFQHLRLIGNRDYDAKPAQCVRVNEDGVTMIVDASQSDILLEAEIVHYAEATTSFSGTERKFQITPVTLRRATQMGKSLDEIDRWFIARTGEPLSSAGRLFLLAPQQRSSHSLQMVVRVNNSDMADGMLQWPETAPLIQERLGPTALVVRPENLPELQKVLERLGMTLADT